jgi:release factor glutamine methyltransferase
VVSNPPYVTEEEYASLPPEVRGDPYGALVGGTRVHRRLADEVPRWLRPHGWLVMEIGASQGPAARDILAEGLEEVEVLPDPAGHDRIVRGRLPLHG